MAFLEWLPSLLLKDFLGFTLVPFPGKKPFYSSSSQLILPLLPNRHFKLPVSICNMP